MTVGGGTAAESGGANLSHKQGHSEKRLGGEDLSHDGVGVVDMKVPAGGVMAGDARADGVLGQETVDPLDDLGVCAAIGSVDDSGEFGLESTQCPDVAGAHAFGEPRTSDQVGPERFGRVDLGVDELGGGLSVMGKVHIDSLLAAQLL